MKDGTAKFLGTLAIGILIGFMLGIWIGSANVDFGGTPAPRIAEAPSKARSQADTKPKPDEDIGVLDRVGAKMVAEVIADMKDSVSTVDLEKLSNLVSWDDGAEKVAKLVINEMSEDELISTLVSLTTLEQERLEEVSDLQGYAGRLTDIAMSGLLTDPIEHDEEGMVPVEFSTEADTDTGPLNPQTRFSAETEKIYAVFTTATYREARVFVHWYRLDNPKLLLLEQYRINHRDEYSYVWLEERKGWEPGEYRVEVFSDTEELEAIALGSYYVVEGE